MTNRLGVALAAIEDVRVVSSAASAVPDGYYRSIKFPGMVFRKRTACDSLAMDTPLVPINEITADPYAAEGKRLAAEDRQRRHHELVHGVPGRYFDWRQSIGNDYYDEQDRISGRVASNDNTPARRAAA